MSTRAEISAEMLDFTNAHGGRSADQWPVDEETYKSLEGELADKGRPIQRNYGFGRENILMQGIPVYVGGGGEKPRLAPRESDEYVVGISGTRYPKLELAMLAGGSVGGGAWAGANGGVAGSLLGSDGYRALIEWLMPQIVAPKTDREDLWPGRYTGPGHVGLAMIQLRHEYDKVVGNDQNCHGRYDGEKDV